MRNHYTSRNADACSQERAKRGLEGSGTALKVLLKLPKSEAEILLAAIAPEVKDVPSHRSVIELKVDEDGLVMEINAKDLVALRASLNSFLRFIDAALNVIRAVSDKAY